MDESTLLHKAPKSCVYVCMHTFFFFYYRAMLNPSRLMWKKKDIPTRGNLIEEILNTAELDILTERLKEIGNNKNIESWSPLYEWLEKSTVGKN